MTTSRNRKVCLGELYFCQSMGKDINGLKWSHFTEKGVFCANLQVLVVPNKVYWYYFHYFRYC